MRKFLLAAASLILLGGCGIYGKYERPELDIDPQFSDIQTPAWREMFTDPLLQNLIDTALVHNTDLGVALLKVEEAEAQLRAAGLSFLPSLSLSGSAGTSAGSSVTLGASSWELDFFGKLLNAQRGKREALTSSREGAQAIRTQLIATLATSYYSLLMLDRQLQISQRTLGTWDKTIETLESLKQAGRSNAVAVLQAQAKKIKLEASIVSIQSSIVAAQNSLCSLMGVEPYAVERGKLEDQSLPVSFADGVPLYAIASRPDIRKAEAALAQTHYAVGSARSAFFPSIVLSGSAGWKSAAGAIADPSAWILSALSSLTQPIFNKGSLKAGLEVAKAQQEEALLGFRQALLDAGMEVNDALCDSQAASERRTLDAAQIDALQQAVDKIMLLMQYSTSNYLEVLTAQQSLLDAELALVQDEGAQLKALVSLYHALGGGQME